MRRPLLCLLFCLALSFSAGCGSEPPASASFSQPVPPADATPPGFNPDSCGTVTGLVTWVGPIPTVKPATQVIPRGDGSGSELRPLTLANAPRIDRVTRGLGGAAVFLRNVSPASAKPWDLPPVKIEFRNSQLLAKQGDRIARSGFVRRGEPVEMLSAEPVVHVLRARGAAFFSLAFPEPGQPLTRTFDACGRVELTSAAGYYWQSADLFVCDHPYYAVSDDEGRFQFTSVPAGRYDLVAWHPNWNIARTERNPESGAPSRLIFAPPLEASRPVAVTRGQTTLANLTLPE